MPRLPFHKYLGPGNDVNEGDAISYADFIAKQHDLAYERAEFEEDIREADNQAIKDFQSAFLEHYDLPSLAGYAGLSLKRKFEELVGRVVYPSGIQSRGEEAKNYWADAKRRRISDNPEPGNDDPQPSTSGTGTDEPLPPALPHRRASSVIDNYFPELVQEIDMADVQSNTDPNRPTSQAQSGSSQSRGAADTGRGNIGDGSDGGKGAGGVSIAESSGKLVTIPPIVVDRKLMFRFEKKFWFYTYGLSHTILQKGTYVGRYSTPYAYYPVTWLPFYVSKNEWFTLPEHSKVVHVNCKVTPLGTRTAFDYNTSLAGTSATEYVPIVKHGIGLNNSFYTESYPLKFSATKPMIPEAYDKEALDKTLKMLWKDYPTAFEVPRHLNWYLMYDYNLNTDAGSPAENIDTTGLYRTDKRLKTTLVNQVLGQVLENYSYSPKNGYVKHAKKALTINYTKANGFPDDVSNNMIPMPGAMPGWLKFTTKKSNYTTAMAKSNLGVAYTVSNDQDYYQQLEMASVLSPDGGVSTAFRNQPHLHIGLVATPALNPGTNSTDFLNSALYTLCENEIIFECDYESMCVDNQSVSWPDDVRFFLAQPKGFNSYGHQNFGYTTGLKGTLKDAAGTTWQEEDTEEGNVGEEIGGDTADSRHVKSVAKRKQTKKIEKSLSGEIRKKLRVTTETTTSKPVATDEEWESIDEHDCE